MKGDLKRSPPRYGVTKPKYKDRLTKLEKNGR